MTDKENTKSISIRERICMYICLFMLKVLKPYEYWHQVDELYKSIIQDLQK